MRKFVIVLAGILQVIAAFAFIALLRIVIIWDSSEYRKTSLITIVIIALAAQLLSIYFHKKSPAVNDIAQTVLYRDRHVIEIKSPRTKKIVTSVVIGVTTAILLGLGIITYITS